MSFEISDGNQSGALMMINQGASIPDYVERYPHNFTLNDSYLKLSTFIKQQCSKWIDQGSFEITPRVRTIFLRSGLFKKSGIRFTLPNKTG